MSKKSRLKDDLFDPEAEKDNYYDGFPLRNELVVATVQDVAKHGAYVSLDDFDRRKAYVHISELSRTWVKNIRVHIREGQRIVAKVLRVDPRRGQIDLSIKRVPDQMKKLKLLESKREQTAKTLFKMIVDKMPKDEREQAIEIRNILIGYYDMLYYGLEFASTAKIDEIEKLGIPKNWAKTIQKIASENIIPATVEIKGTAEISIPGGNGVNHLKEALIAGKEKVTEKNTTIRIYTEGSPRYSIEVKSEDYKIAERALDNALKRIEDIVDSHNGSFNFERKK